MQKDLATAIGTALIGAVIAYFVCNLFLSPIEDVTFKTIQSDVSIDIIEPSSEVFNYRALNPTVEVFVGDCTKYDERGECIDDETIQSLEEVITDQGSTTNPENQ